MRLGVTPAVGVNAVSGSPGARRVLPARACSPAGSRHARTAAVLQPGALGRSFGAAQARRRAPQPPSASAPSSTSSSSSGSQLSEADLQELLAENAKLKQLLASYKDRLTPEQVEKLTKQYEEIAALAAAAGLQLEGSLLDDPPPAAKGPQPKAIEVNEGDRKVKAWVVDKGDVVQFNFDSATTSSSKKPPKAPAAATGGSKAAAAAAPKAAAAAPAPAAKAPPAAKAAPAAPAPAAPAAPKAAAAPSAGKPPAAAAASSSASSAVASFIQATTKKAAGGATSSSSPPPAAAAAAAAAAPAKPAAPAPAPAKAAPVAARAAPAAPAAEGGDSDGRFSKWRSAINDKGEAKAVGPAGQQQPPAKQQPAKQPQQAPAPAAAAQQPAPAAAAKQPAPAAAAPAASAAAAPPKPAAPAAPAAAAPPPPPAAAPAQQAPPPQQPGVFMPPPPPAARLMAQARAAQPPAAPPAFTASNGAPPPPPPAAAAAPPPPPAPAAAPPPPPPPAPAASGPPPMTTAIVDVGPPKVPEVEDILDIPDPVDSRAVPAYVKPTPAEQARIDQARAAVRAAAEKELAAHNPSTCATVKHSWLMFTVPEKPVAGCDVIVYYNRTQSETLRDRNRIQLVLGFNKWELPSEQGKVDLGPSPIPHVDNSDFWSCRFRVPENAYECNFVLTDGETLFDNNSGQDYTYPTLAGITWEEWAASAAERREEKEQERQKEEQARRDKEAKEIQAEKEKSDRDNALRRVAELRDGYLRMVEGSVTRRKVDPTDEKSKTYWYVMPRPPLPGKKLTLLYNSKAGPLKWIEDKRTNKDKTATVEGQQVPRLLVGFNNWQVKPEPILMKHASIPGDDDECWWEASFDLPKDCLSVSFVVNCEGTWDNNGSKDHKIAVDLPKPHTAATVGEWAEEQLPSLIKQERENRIKAEKEAAEKEAKRLANRNLAKDKAKAVMRRQMKHVMFTEPEVMQAGQRVTVYYCPDDTSLAGASEVYFRGGFNRWSHPRQLGPVLMRPPGPNGRHWQVRFSVPKDALQLDFVFSDVPEGDGRYDNRGGFDYHLPITGGTGTLTQRLHVVHMAVEMAPIAKVGGLGDVVTALGRAVQEEGHLVEVVLPRYDFLLHSPVLAGQMRHETEFDWGGTRIFVSTATVEGLRCFFIEPKNGFFATPTVYGRYDDEVRFDFFCKAALEFLLKTGRQPDILHCHDWSTAHMAKSFWEDYQPYGLWKPKVVFTIHNMNYGQKKIAEAAAFCQSFTTVSPTYAFEVGSHPAIAANAHKFLGIRNGIDADIWSPEDNPFLPMPYSAANAEEGKRRAREEMRKRTNLNGWQDKMVIAVVSRLTPQKGVHLIKHAAYKAVERGCQFVLLGSAPDPKVQEEFDALANELRHGQEAGFVFEYNEPLSHLIYAGADVLLVPSMFEPCGLTQMIAMRYGAVPVVRHTGGLRDTVFDVDNDKPRAAWEVTGSSDWVRDKVDETNGFAFEGMDEGGLDYALDRCIDAYYNDKAWFRSLQARIMRQDWSWNRPALDYVELYYAVCRGE